MIDLGTVRPGRTIRIPFSSFDKDDGSSITMTNFAVADILVYKDGSTTERASTSGYTATTDFDGKTGKHLIVIDLADNTTAGFWSAGSEYLVAVDAVTVDTVTVGAWVARFRIGYPSSIFDTTIATLASQTSFTLTTGPAEDNALNGLWVIVHDVASAVQCSEAIISAYTGSTRTVTLTAGATFTVAAGDNISIMGLAPLQPTVLGRTLDVSATGEAGVDWANVGGATTTVGLTNTTVGTVTTTTTATNLTNERGKYMLGCVWIGSVANTNTTSYVDGIMTNPVSTVAAAKSIADNLGLKRFWVQAGATATLAADMAGYVFEGRNFTLATSGSRAFTGSGAIGATAVTGTYTSAGAPPYWVDCEFGATVSVPPSNFMHCEFGGTTTFNAAGNYDLIDCASVVAGTSAPVFAIPAGTVNVSFRRWSGGIRITGITSGTTISIDVVSGGTVTLEGANGNVQVRGMCAGITDSRTGTPTLGSTAVVNQTLIATPTNITAGTITTVSGNVNGSVGSVTGAVGSVTGNVGGNVAGSVASVTGAVGSVTGNVGGNVTGSVGSLATQAKSDVNAEVVDALNTDTYAEPTQGAPGATVSLATKLGYLYKAWRNRAAMTASQYSLYNDDAATVDHKASFSDNGTTADRGEIASGP